MNEYMTRVTIGDPDIDPTYYWAESAHAESLLGGVSVVRMEGVVTVNGDETSPAYLAVKTDKTITIKQIKEEEK